MNEIKHKDSLTEAHCIICGGLTKHYHYEKRNANNSGAVCMNCCKGEVKIPDTPSIVYHCDNCDRDITDPAKGPGGLLFCSTPNCGAVVKPKDD